jgi:hypothetical protein
VLDMTVTMIRNDFGATERSHAAACKAGVAGKMESARLGRFPRRAVAIISAVALAASLGGCQTQTIPPPSANLRAQFSEIGVNVSGASPTAPTEPIKGAGAAAGYGAGQGALGSMGFAAGGCMNPSLILCALGVALSVVTLPFTAAGGAIIGASKAHEPAEVEAASATIRKTLETTDFGNLIETAVIREGQRLTKPHLTEWISSDEVVPPVNWPPLRLDLLISEPRFQVEGKIDPDITLFLALEGRIVRTDTEEQLYWRSWAYRGRARRYFDMAKDEGMLLRKEIESASEVLARQVVTDLFVSNMPVDVTKGSIGAEGTAWTVNGQNGGAPRTATEP